MTQYRATVNGKPITQWCDYRTAAIMQAHEAGHLHGFDIEVKANDDDKQTPVDVIGKCLEIMGLK